MKFGLSNEVINQINQVFRDYPEIDKVIIYGSRAKGNYRVGSDIDLMLISDNVSYSMLLKIISALDELLLPYSIDLSCYQQIENPNLLEHINRIGQIFYQKAGVAGWS